MNNPYISYYYDQVGGLQGFSGVSYQRGHGWFSRVLPNIFNFFKGLVVPAAKKALPSAIGLAQDILAGENVAHSAKNRLVEAGRSAANETLEQLRERLQKGKGIGRRRRRISPFMARYNFGPAERKRRKTNKKKTKSRKSKK